MIRILLALLLCLSPSALFSGNSGPKGNAAEKRSDPFGAKRDKFRDAGQSERHALQRDLQRLPELLRQQASTETTWQEGRSDLLQRKAATDLARNNGGPVEIYWDEKNLVPIFIKGTRLQSRSLHHLSKLASEDFEAQGKIFLEEISTIMKIDSPSEEFVHTEIVRDDLGFVHIRYQQTYGNVEVWGRDIRVHLSSDGNVESMNGRFVPTPRSIAKARTNIDQASALDIALRTFQGRPTHQSSRKIILVDDHGTPHLCWMVQIRGRLDENLHYFVDVTDGRVRKIYNHVMTDGPIAGSGSDLFNKARSLNVYQIGALYYMIDASKPMFNAGQSKFPQDGKGVIYTLDARNTDTTFYFATSNSPTTWTVKSAVSASANFSSVYDFYRIRHNRNAIDGKGTSMNVVVNYSKSLNNAFWNGQFVGFGNGDGVAFSDLAGSLDVTAHEMTHGVVEHTANLVYETQPGALNESFSDVFGVLFEFWIDPANANWLLGETVTTPNIPGDALRDMANPGSPNVAFNGQQPAHMSEYKNLPNTANGDHGGVHINSGIPNRAFYLFATSPGVTLEEAGRVYYRALTTYLTRNSQFVDCRLAVIKAAEDLFGGTGNAKALAAASAFNAVGIMSGASTPPPPTLPPVQGTNYLAVIDAQSGFLYRSSPTGTNIAQLTNRSLFSRPSVSDDGSSIIYVDQTNNIRFVRSDGAGDQALTTSGGFNNIALSPNGRYLAATTVFVEPRIYLFDLVNPAGDRVFELYTPTYSKGVSTGNILLADRIDWASDSKIFMYDAFNLMVNASGDTTGYWDINLLRIADTSIARLFPPQPPGVSIGNPVFASNKDNIIAFDYLAPNDSVRVLAVDLTSGKTGQVTNNWFSLGSPSFSHDDKKVFYHYIDQSSSVVFVVDLLADGITGKGNDQVILNGGMFPVSFTVGSRPTPVEDTPLLPSVFALKQNYPNPFNPVTTIAYDVPAAGLVSLRVYDVLGREVKLLANEVHAAGSYRVQFDGVELPSGVYFLRLTSQTVALVRKMVLTR